MFKIVIFILFAALTGSWCWAMRGTIIGGEKGAMLPGAILGLLISRYLWNFGTDIIFKIACIGAFSMFMGGSCTYGETLNFVLRNKEDCPYHNGKKRGYTGVFINGGNWFSLTAYFISVAFQSVGSCPETRHYSDIELLVITLAMPFIQQIGQFIFNFPYNKEKNIHSKIYFSLTRREEWGGTLLYLFFALACSFIKGDYVSFLGIILCYLAGGAGFMLGLHFYHINKEKRILAFLEDRGFIGNWKMMEMTLGAVGFGFTALYFICFKNLFYRDVNFVFDDKLSVLTDTDKIKITALIILGCYLIKNLIELIYPKLTGKKITNYVSDIFMRPFFCAFPLALVLLSDNKETYAYIAIIYLLFVLTEKCFDGWFRKAKEKNILNSVVLIYSLIIAIFLFNKTDISIFEFALVTIIPYQLTSLLHDFNITEIKMHKHELKNHFSRICAFQSNMLLQAVLIIIGAGVLSA